MRALRILLIPLVTLVILVTYALGLVSGSPVQHVNSDIRGDHRLVTDLSDNEVSDIRSLAVLRMNGEDTQFAYKNATASTRFEVGSLTKLLTIELYGQAVMGGRVNTDTQLGEIFDLEGSSAATITLDELSHHESGLSEWGGPDGDGDDATTLLASLRGESAHQDASVEELLSRARQDPLNTRGSFHYSNIGIALLGLALADAAEVPYATLLADGVTNPLQMTTTTVPTSSTLNPPRGVNEAGQSVASWPLGAYAPAGGALSSAMDIARFSDYLLDTTEIPEGYPHVVYRGMNLTEYQGRTILTKTGVTGGFRSVLVLDLETDSAVIVLSDTDRSVEELAIALLSDSE
ncbi:serine hydrolase domain-containing protein [Corynebacterium alimapuense]|uniref:Beta-lactamase-related domain-containing protein n=1 Tax=Corynebacterium alimapuense TaxID=1576874 RepID=A0A3M8K9Y3_9CORY|nr:serine hydrolase domain-containing protein [Corynebacterium alimapuense]RNE50027.1 hypothetical protein C5L39_01265 [Corynebacterium alimapuense]